MRGLSQIVALNQEFDRLPLDTDDTQDSWTMLNREEEHLTDPRFGCGIQPWSRGPAYAANGITEREWNQQRNRFKKAA